MTHQTITFDPARYALVPKEAEIPMVEAAFAEEISLSTAHSPFGVERHVWEAMLAAAPELSTLPGVRVHDEEPVAWSMPDDNGAPFRTTGYDTEAQAWKAKGHTVLPLYAHPPAPPRLSEERIKEIARYWGSPRQSSRIGTAYTFGPESINYFARAIESALSAPAEASQPAQEQPSDLTSLHEVACDLHYLFGRASLEGHAAGQELATKVQAKMQAALDAFPSAPQSQPTSTENVPVRFLPPLLPALPSPYYPQWSHSNEFAAYTADQMREYASAAIAATLKEQ